MGEGPKDLRDEDARRFDPARGDDAVGRGEPDVTGRPMTGPEMMAPIPGAYPLGPVPTESTAVESPTWRPSGERDSSTAAGGTRETAEIRAEIEQKRADISETLDEIQQRLSPGNLMSQATDTVREATRQRVRRVADTASETASHLAESTRQATYAAAERVREHPWSAGAVLAGIGAATWWMMSRPSSSVEDWDVDDYTEESLYYDDDLTAGRASRVMGAIRDNSIPIALTTIGIGWWMWNQRAGRHASFGSSYTGRSGYGAAGADAGTYRTFDSERGVWVGDESGATERVKSAVSNATERARDAMDDVGDRTRDMASRAQQQIGDVGRRARNQLEYWMDRNPLAVGAVAMAVGAAVGLALPDTRREHELMGRTSERVVDRAQRLAGSAVETAKDKAREAVDRATEAFKDATSPRPS